MRFLAQYLRLPSLIEGLEQLSCWNGRRLGIILSIIMTPKGSSIELDGHISLRVGGDGF